MGPEEILRFDQCAVAHSIGEGNAIPAEAIGNLNGYTPGTTQIKVGEDNWWVHSQFGTFDTCRVQTFGPFRESLHARNGHRHGGKTSGHISVHMYMSMTFRI